MDQNQVPQKLQAAISIKREDIARAKQFIMTQSNCFTEGLAEPWLQEQKITSVSVINFLADDAQQQIETVAREYSVLFALLQAVWELIASGDVVPVEACKPWKPQLGFNASRPGASGSQSGQFQLHNITFPYIPQFYRLKQDVPADTDIFLSGINTKSLHTGIREAVEQSLNCFRRGLYMPATAMLAAAAEATWTECGIKVAVKLSNTKLDGIVTDPYASISKKVTETRKALEGVDGKALLKTADRTIADVNNAELWTTALRERRNALHWNKAKSFAADHSETGTLLMGAPRHLGTLEAIRLIC
jgi:hypothetical protein